MTGTDKNNQMYAVKNPKHLINILNPFAAILHHWLNEYGFSTIASILWVTHKVLVHYDRGGFFAYWIEYAEL